MSDSAEDVLTSEQGAGPDVSPRVAKLAQDIYDEFQNIIDQFGPDAVQSLAPLVVNVLENLDNALGESEDNDRELVELTEKYEMLAQQYEKERHRRKEAEERSFQLEDANDIEIRQLKEKVASMTTENQTATAKVQQQDEQIIRLMDESDMMKKEAADLKQRHIDAIKQYSETIEAMKEQYQMKVAEFRRSNSFNESEQVPGYQDFVTPAQPGSGKVKRKLPVVRKQRIESSDQAALEATLEAPPRELSPTFSSDYSSGRRLPGNKKSLAVESKKERLQQNADLEEEEEYSDEYEEDDLLGAGASLQNILIENEELLSEKNELARELREMEGKMKELSGEASSMETAYRMVQADNEGLQSRLHALEDELKTVKRELQEARDLLTEEADIEPGRSRVDSESGEGGRRLEWARLLKERNEYKEKYYSLLDQVKLNDELSLFKSKPKRSKWLDYLVAIVSPAKRREMEQASVTPQRRLLMGTNRMPGADTSDDEEDGLSRQPSVKKIIIPTLRNVPRREDLLMSAAYWFFQSQFSHSPRDIPSPTFGRAQSGPNVSILRPVSYQEEGAQVLCAAAVNTAMFIGDHTRAVKVKREPDNPADTTSEEDKTMSLLWVCTGVTNLSKISVIDAGGVGDVVETFPVASDTITCIAAVPEFDEQDPEVLASVSMTRRKPQERASDRPSSQLATMWIGSVSGVLYVHSAVAMWKKCLHADKLPAPIIAITHSKGKVFILLSSGNVAVFRRFEDGEWDFDNYSIVVLGQRKELPVTCLAAVNYNVWCGTGNYVHVVGGSSLKMEAAFIVHPRKKSEITQMIGVGDGVWVSIKYDPTIRLFHASSFQHMQDLDISPPVHRMLAFHTDRRLSRVVVRISSMVAAHNSLWIGTENGIVMSFPFSSPTIVAEEAGWEVMKEAVVSKPRPEPLDVRIDQAADVVKETEEHTLETVDGSTLSCTKGEREDSHSPRLSPSPSPMSHFNPFCAVDQMSLSVHCHINAVRQLLCVPGMVTPQIDVFEPLSHIKVTNTEQKPPQPKPALFVVSFGEGHLDLRTTDKVIQTLNARPGQGGLPDPSTIISDKNYIMVWEQTL